MPALRGNGFAAALALTSEVASCILHGDLGCEAFFFAAVSAAFSVRASDGTFRVQGLAVLVRFARCEGDRFIADGAYRSVDQE
jgi:hypothetical protein